MRELGILFGNTSFAAATTLAAFFLGIAAGGVVFGRAAQRVARPRAGLDLYRSRVLERLGDDHGAAAALERYEAVVGGTR